MGDILDQVSPLQTCGNQTEDQARMEGRGGRGGQTSHFGKLVKSQFDALVSALGTSPSFSFDYTAAVSLRL